MPVSTHQKFSLTSLSKAVTLACLLTSTSSLFAADVCGSGTTNISTAQATNDNCVLESSDSLTVSASGSFDTSQDRGSNAVIVGFDGAISDSVSNSGVITAGNSGIAVIGGVSGGITNSGTVSANGVGIGVFSGSNIIDDIVNSGSISGGTGIIFSNTTSTGLDNSGQITGQFDGVSTFSSTLSGGLNNTGTISGGVVGIDIKSTNIDSGINNSGMILGREVGLEVSDGAVINGGITNSGEISGTSSVNEPAVENISISFVDDLIGDPDNSVPLVFNETVFTLPPDTGVIFLPDDEDTGDDFMVLNGSSFPERRGIEVSGNSVINGGINNSGSISVSLSSGAGIEITGQSVVNGGINNSGSISGGGVFGFVGGFGGIEISDQSTVNGGITNTGTISDIQVIGSTIDTITNGAGGMVSSILIDADSTVTNDVNNLSGGLIRGQVSLLNGANLNNAGILSISPPSLFLSGDSVIDGNYSQTGNGIVEFGVSADGIILLVPTEDLSETHEPSYSTLTINGTVDLTENNQIGVNVRANVLEDGEVLEDVLTFGSLAAGIPEVVDNRALLEFTAVDDGENNLDLVARRLSVTELASRRGGDSGLMGVAGAFDGIIGADTTDDLTIVTNTLTSLDESNFVNALQQLNPSFSAGTGRATLNLSNTGGSQVVRNRIAELNDPIAGVQLAYNGPLSGLFANDVEHERYVWVQPFGSRTEQDTTDGVFGFTARTTGIALGTDSRVEGGWRVGGALSYARGTVDDNTSVLDESLDIDTYQATVYGAGKVLGDKTLNLQAALGKNDNESSRHINFGGLDREAEADFDSWHAQLSAELVYAPYKLGTDSKLTPVVGLDYSYVSVDSYTEEGAGAANLDVDDSSEDSLVISVGGRLAHKLNSDSVFTANFEVGHDFMAEQSSVTSTFTGGGPSFRTEGIEPSSTVVRAGLGLAMKTQDDLEVIASYDVEGRSDFDNQTLSVRLRWPF